VGSRLGDEPLEVPFEHSQVHLVLGQALAARGRRDEACAALGGRRALGSRQAAQHDRRSRPAARPDARMPGRPDGAR